MFKNNEFSSFSKWLVTFALLIPIAFAGKNFIQGDVKHPALFFVIVFGFLLFLIAKLSVIIPKKKVSFGTNLMSTSMANLYRLGYLLMVLGAILTFL